MQLCSGNPVTEVTYQLCCRYCTLVTHELGKYCNMLCRLHTGTVQLTSSHAHTFTTHFTHIEHISSRMFQHMMISNSMLLLQSKDQPPVSLDRPILWQQSTGCSASAAGRAQQGRWAGGVQAGGTCMCCQVEAQSAPLAYWAWARTQADPPQASAPRLQPH